MECRERTPSVIARLMGLDKLPSQQPSINKEQRVLPETYLRKTASIGAREKRLSPERSPFRMKIDEQQRCKDILEVPESVSEFNRNVRSEPANNPCVSTSKIIVLKPKHEKARKSISSSAYEEFLSGAWIHKDSSSLQIGDSVTKVVANKIESTRYKPKFPMDTEEVRHSLPNYSNWKKMYSNGSSLALVARQHISDRWKTTKRFQEAGSASRGTSLGEMFASPDQEIIHKEACTNNGKHGINTCLGEKNGEKRLRPASRIGSEEGCKDGSTILSQSLHGLPDSVKSPKCSGHIRKNRAVQDELSENFEKDLCEKSSILWSSFVGVGSKGMVSKSASDAKTESEYSETEMKQQLETKACMTVKGCKSSFNAFNSSHQQDFSTRSPRKPDFVPKKGTTYDPDSPVSSENASQPSPVSVLDLCSQQEKSSRMEVCKGVATDLNGLWMQLQLLKADSSDDERSEGSGMNVSSDETDEEESKEMVKHERLIEFSSTKESKDFSYLVDILSDAGYNCSNLETCLKTWHSLDTPINPDVFKTLEKRYGQQAHKEKLELKLLFDRINSALVGILESCIHTHTQGLSVSKKVSSCRKNSDLIEEEVWAALVRQEKETNMNKMEINVFECGDDFDLGIEIEKFLIEELVTECLQEIVS